MVRDFDAATISQVSRRLFRLEVSWLEVAPRSLRNMLTRSMAASTASMADAVPSGVVTSRGDVHYIATEFGIVNLHGQNLRERALSLISIAHPDFRDDLLDYAKKRNLVHMDQMTMAIPGSVYPEQYEEARVFEGGKIFFRPVKPVDEAIQREFLYSLSNVRKPKYIN